MNTTAIKARKVITLWLSCLILCWISLICVSGCTPFESRQNEGTKLVFTFDDADRSIYELAFPMMQEYGFRGTNFVNSNSVGNPALLSWEELREMELDYAWETGAHTLNHEDLTQISPMEAMQNISQDRLRLIDEGLSPRSFALPKGQAPAQIYQFLGDLFSNIRSSSDFAMYHPVNRHSLGYLPVQSGWSADIIKSRILRGLANRETLIIIGFHRFDADENVFSDSCSSDTFREILDFADQLNLQIIPLAEAF